MKKISFLMIIFAILFASCGSTKVEKPNLNKVYVTNTNKVDLLPPAALTAEIDEYQLFEATFATKDGEQKMNATVYLQADSSGIDIVLLNDFGIEMGTISYDGMNAAIESNIFPKKLKAEYILLDLQNAYIDSKILKEHYKKYKLDFDEISTNITTDDGGFSIGERHISKKGKVIETISIGNGSITIKNHLRGYEYKLTKAED